MDGREEGVALGSKPEGPHGGRKALYLDSIRVDTLAVTLNYSSARHYHRDNWIECAQDSSILFLTLHVNLQLSQSKKVNLKEYIL